MKNLTVGKLIKELQKFNPDMEVVISTPKKEIYEKLKLSNQEYGDAVTLQAS